MLHFKGTYKGVNNGTLLFQGEKSGTIAIPSIAVQGICFSEKVNGEFVDPFIQVITGTVIIEVHEWEEDMIVEKFFDYMIEEWNFAATTM